MEHALRAEYEVHRQSEPMSLRGSEAAVKNWHVVRNDGTTAMCGRELAADAEQRPIDEWTRDELKVCHRCGAFLLREVPPSEDTDIAPPET